MRISQIEAVAAAGGGIALWGWGREGQAAYRALRARTQARAVALTLFCSAEEAEQARALGDPALTIETEASAERLAACAVVIKSPGIGGYRPELLAAAARGTRFVGGSGLWFAERVGVDGVVPGTVCVTGSKGKSTTTALLAHLLRAGGARTALAGNIGLPLLELVSAQADAWAIELSSYQTRDVAASGARPEVAVVTNLFPEHLDWHGDETRYFADKLALVSEARPRVAVLNAEDARLATLSLPDSELRWFNRADAWHLRGELLYRGDTPILDTAGVPLPGRHNRSNLCAVLTAIEALGLDAPALARHAASFAPLPHRLQTLGTRDGVVYVNDSISTTPHATLAALALFRDRRVAVLVGGYDRGLDWTDFAAAVRAHAPAAIVTLGQNGPRIHALLRPLAEAGGFALRSAADLGDAVAQARAALVADAPADDPAPLPVLLLSPGAPSFGAYRDYAERGRDFARIAGFDADAIAAIPGLGIA